jgi:hypothetical protein
MPSGVSQTSGGTSNERRNFPVCSLFFDWGFSLHYPEIWQHKGRGGMCPTVVVPLLRLAADVSDSGTTGGGMRIYARGLSVASDVHTWWDCR